MDNEEYEETGSSVNSSSSNLLSHGSKICNSASDNNNSKYDFGYPFNFGISKKKDSKDVPADAQWSVTARAPAITIKSKPCSQIKEKQNCLQCNDSAEEPFAFINQGDLSKLKDSTRKLICLLEEIQCKTQSRNGHHQDCDESRLTELLKPIPFNNAFPSVTDLIGASALKKLEKQAETLQNIYAEDDEDDCSIYKRLTRKCHCLNEQNYNDFIIHFNEDTKYFTTNRGEIIKNMRILKKFLYMGGEHGKHALMFLNQGLLQSTHTEKVEIIHGCSHADICNIFEEHSIVIICISWPCKYNNIGDSETQALTADILYKLAQVEEGRRYLKYSSKITNDIKKVIRKKASKLDFQIVETLNAILNLMHSQMNQFTNTIYYSKSADEGFGNKTATALVQYRQYMTLTEILSHLDCLHNLSNNDSGKHELTTLLPALLSLFKNLLLEYNNSAMNIIITNILNNIVSKNMVKPINITNAHIMVDTETVPILMKNETVQMPPKKSSRKDKSKVLLSNLPNRFRQPSKKKVADWEHPVSQRTINTSRKFHREFPVIVVPVDK